MKFVTKKQPSGLWAVYRKGADRPVMAGLATRTEALAWRDFYNANPTAGR